MDVAERTRIIKTVHYPSYPRQQYDTNFVNLTWLEAKISANIGFGGIKTRWPSEIG